MQFHHLAAMALVAATASAQLPFDRTIVATRLTGTAAQTQLLAIDAQGVVTPFPRFPSDIFAPLAIEYDPIDGHILLAIALSSTTSRVLRLIPAGVSIQRELALGDISAGHVTQLAAVGDIVYASVGGMQGGLWRFERRRCCAQHLVSQPNLDAMFVFGQQHSGILAWSPATTPAAPSGLAYFDFIGLQPLYGPFNFGAFQPAVTGVTDVPTGVPRQLLSFADGTIATFAGFFGPPVPIILAPQPPPGGAVAMKSPGPAFDAIGLGGSSHPFLYHIDPNLGVVTNLAGPLPGDPVDFTLALPRVAQTLPFSIPCGTPSLIIGSSSAPSLGNAQFRIDLTGGTANQGCLFVAGFDDETVSGGPVLPQVLPGGCVLHVEPLVVNFHVTSAGGAASQPLAVPNLPQLNGTFVFAQWLQIPGTAFIGSAGLSVQVGP